MRRRASISSAGVKSPTTRPEAATLSRYTLIISVTLGLLLLRLRPPRPRRLAGDRAAPVGGQVLGASLAAAPGELGSVLSEQVRRPGHLRHDWEHNRNRPCLSASHTYCQHAC